MSASVLKPGISGINHDRYVASDIEVWPNGMGVNFAAHDARWEVMIDVPLRKFAAVRRDAESDDLTHIWEIAQFGEMPTDAAGLIDLVCLAWMDLPHLFPAIVEGDFVG